MADCDVQAAYPTDDHVKDGSVSVAGRFPFVGCKIDAAIAALTRSGSSRLYLRTFLVTFLLGATGIVGFSWYVNPWGNFGPTGFHILGDARRAKADHLDAIPREDLPQVVVLGSSNVMRFRPSSIERELGKPAFNFGVFWGKAEDFLCISSYLVKDLHHRPDLLIVGMDTWAFAPPKNEHPLFPGTRRRLLNTPQLVRHHPDVNRVINDWSKFVDTFSGQQLRHSWKLIHMSNISRQTRPPLAESRTFEIDGTRVFYGDVFTDRGNIFEATEAGRYPITKILRSLVREGRLDKLDDYAAIYDFEGFWSRRVQYAEEMLRLCSANGIQVVFVINPVHPVFLDLLYRETPHRRNLERLHGILKRFQRDHDIVVGTVDAMDLAAFGGDPQGFYDVMHPATRNCDLIIGRIAQLIRSQ